MKRIVCVMLWMTFAATTQYAQAQIGSEIGNFCVRDYRAGANCTANDVRIEALTVETLIEGCNEGVIGETEVAFNALVSADGSPDRYDIGLFLATDGGSARDGDSCLHAFLDAPLTVTPVYGDFNGDTVDDIVNGPWWDAEGDSCGDIETNTQVFATLPPTRFVCADNNLDGSVDVNVCTSWDNNAGGVCSSVSDAVPGTGSKCSCSDVELGIAPTYAFLDKVADAPIVESGTAATFTITATNTGIENLINVVLSDPQCDVLTGPFGDVGSDGVFGVAETWTWNCTVNNVTAGFTNTATLTGEAETSGNIENQVATADVQVADLTTSKALTANADEDGSSSVSLNDTLTYTITVTNTGEVNLTNVVVTDPMLTPTGGTTPCASVPPLGTCTLIGTYVVQQTDVDNGAISNTGTGDSDETGPDTDTVITIVPSPELTVTKTAVLTTDGGTPGVADLGDVITFSVTVENTGNVVLDNLAVNDPMGGGILTCAPTTLNPGEIATCNSYTYTVLQSDVDAGGTIDNTATATAEDPDNNPVTDNDSTSTPIVAAAPALTTTKVMFNNDDLDGSGTVSLNDILSYSVTVTNTGNVTLNNVIVTDTLITPNSTSCATVAPGATCVLVGSYIVTQADVDAGVINNTGTGDSDETGPATDDVSIPVPQNPALSVSKVMFNNNDVDGSGTVSLNDILSYSVTVTNTGNVTLNNVTVTDTLITPNSTTCATVAPGATCVLVGSYIVTQADVDAGVIDNTGTGDSDETGPATDDVSIPVPQNPALTTVKTLTSNADEDGSGTISLNDTLTFTITVTNTGNVTLNNVTVSDPQLTPNLATCPTVAPGATCQLVGTYVITQADVDNGSFSNTGTGDSDETPPADDTVVTPIPQNPALTTVKALTGNADEDGSGTISLYDTLTFTITVTNTGNVTLNNVTASDPQLTPNLATCPTVAPGATCQLVGTYVVTQADVDNGSFSNTGTGDSDETPPSDDTVVTPIPQNPALTTVKALTGNADEDGSGTVSLNDTLTFTITVTNTGNVTLNNVTVSDPQLTPNLATCPTVAPGATCQLVGTYVITQADVDNGSFSNTGTGDSDETPPADDTVVTPIPQNPALTTVKILTNNADEDGSGTVSLNDTLTFTITVTNTGDVTLNNVTVSDPQLTPNLATCPTVAPGATCQLVGTYVVTQADVDNGSFSNTGTGDSDETPPSDDTVVTPIPQNPALTTVKAFTGNADEDGSGTVSLNDTLTFTITVTNTGDVTLNNVTVSDPQLTPNLATCPTVAPGATCQLVGTYVITQADVDNGSFSNTGTGDSDETPPSDDTVVTPIPQNPALTTVKALTNNADEDGSGTVTLNDTLTFTITVTNTGDVTLNNVTVSDPQLTPNLATCPTVAPGATCQLVGTYVITQADVDNGSFSNTGTGDSDETPPSDDTVVTPIPQNPALTTVKALTGNADEDGSGTVSLNDTLTFTITVTNTGNVTLNNVTVSDPQLTPNLATCPTVAPGATCQLVGTYVVQQSDVDNGSFTNTGTGDSDETPPSDDTVVTPIGGNPALTTVKALTNNADEDGSGTVSLNDTLTFTITVTNTGDVTLNNVTVSDPQLTPNLATCPMVAPSATCVLVGTYVVTQADVDNGSFSNTGTGDSDETPPSDDTVVTPIPQNPALNTVKLLTNNADEDGSTTVTLGDTLTFTITVTNTGNVTLTNVTVSDPMITPNSNTCPTVAPGATCVLVGTYVVQQSDVDNGQVENTAVGDSTETPPDPETIITFVSDPQLVVTKTAVLTTDGGTPGVADVGDVITFSVTVENTGNVVLDTLVVNDPMGGGALTCAPTTLNPVAPGNIATCNSYTYTVLQSDVDAGGTIDNTATATADDPADNQVTDNDSTSTPIAGAVPALMTVKALTNNADEDASGTVSLNDTLTFTITVTNIGNVTLNNVVVTDTLITPAINVCPTVAPGATCVLVGTYVVQQSDVDNGSITNTGTGDSDETPPADDTVVTPIPQNPALTTVKAFTGNADEDGSGTVSLNDTLTFTITVTNTGNVTLNNVTVSDPQLTPNLATCPTVAPGATCQLVGTYVVTQADVDNGSFSNTGTGDSDETPPSDDTVVTPIPQNPALTTVKTFTNNADEDGSGTVSLNDTLTFTITVTNTGDVTLNNVTVSDPQLTPNLATCPTVAPGATCQLVGTYVITQADVDNGSFSNTGTGDSDETPPSDDTVVTPIPQNPALTTVKALTNNADEDGSGTVTLNDTLTFTITVTNTGDVTLNNVTVSDPQLTPNLATCPTVAPGATCQLVGTYVITQADVDNGSFSNTGTGDSDETPPSDDTVVTPIPQNPALTTVKALTGNADEDGSGTVSLNDTLTFTITVTNTGNVTLNNVTVSDPQLTPNLATCPTVAPGATCQLVGTYVVQQSDVDNGSFTNTGTGDSDETPPSDDTVVTPIGGNPALTTVKTLTNNADEDGSGTVSLNDTLTFTITVTNTGDVTLNNVTVSDPQLTPNLATCPTVAPSATCVLVGTYVVTQTDVDNGSFSNTGTGDSDETPPSDDTVVTPIPQNPALNTVKLLTNNADEDGSTTVTLGDTLTFTITVTNTGNVTLTNVTVSDPMITPNSNTCPTVAPGATCVLVGTYVVQQSDVDNGQVENTAVGDSTETPPDPETIITFVSDPQLVVTKTAVLTTDGGTPGVADVGDVITFSVTVENTGNVVLDTLVVNDPMGGGALTCAPTTLNPVAPGNIATCNSYTYTVLQSDVDAGGTIDNTATATADDPADNQVTDNDSTSTPIAGAVPALMTVKALTNNADEDASGTVSLNDTLTFTITVTNIGNVTLNNVVVTDTLITPAINVCPTVAPGATCVLVGTYVVQQSDVDNGSITNTGTGDSDETPPADDTVVTPIGSNPALTTVKTLTNNADEDGSGTVSLNDTLTFTITVTNTGDVTLNNVTVSDPQLTPNLATCPTVAPSATCVLVGTYVVTQADVDNGSFSNTGTGDSDETPPSDDTVVTPIPQNPALNTVKLLTNNADEDGSTTVTLGDTLTFTITVTNTGNVTLTNVTVSDPMITPNSNTCPAVAPAATCVLVGTYVVQQSDVDNGQVENTAVGDSTETPPDPETIITFVSDPQLVVTKTAVLTTDGGTPGVADVGDVITFSVTVENTGNVVLDTLVVNDPMGGGALTCAPTTLNPVAPGNIATCNSYTYTVLQSDVDAGGTIDNTATATADDPADNQVTDNDSTSTPIAGAAAAIQVTKTATLTTDGGTPGVADAGDVITFSVVVQNIGNVTLDNLLVVDPMGGGLLTCGPTTLIPGQFATCSSYTYNVTQADVDNGGTIDNTASAVAEDPSNNPVGDDDSTSTPIAAGAPSLVTVKALTNHNDVDNDGNITVGDILTFTITATNNGTVTLNNVVVSDPMITPNSNTCLTVAPGANCQLVGTYTVQQSDVDNGQIQNTGTGDSDETPPDPDTVVTPIPQSPAIAVTKTATLTIDNGTPGIADVGDEITFAVSVQNTGNVTLTSLVVTDPMGGGTLTCAPTTLAPAQIATCNSYTYTVTQTDVDNGGTIDNTASATALDPNNNPVNDSDSTSTPIAVGAPSLVTVKTLSNHNDVDNDGNITVGDILTFTIVATNNGNVTLNNVVVSDPMITPNSNTCPTVAPGATCQLVGTYTVQQSDVDNGQVENTGTGDSDETPPVPDTVITPVPRTPALTVTKTATLTIDNGTPNSADAGDEITFAVSVQNTGNVTLTSLVVTDPMGGGTLTCTPTTLAPGQIATCNSYTYTVTQADVDNGGTIDNTAAATAMDPTNNPVNDDDSTSTPITVAGPSLVTVKSLTNHNDVDNDGNITVGDILTFTITATNNGNVTLNNVVVSDPMITPNSNTCPTVAPGATCQLVGTYTIQQSDVDNGQVENTGTGDSDETPPVPDTVITPLPQNPALTVTKTATLTVDNGTPNSADAGDEITFAVTVQNTGDVTLTNLVVTDPMGGGTLTCAPTTLAPAQTSTCNSYTYTVTQADVDNGGTIDNTASATAQDPNNSPVSDDDSTSTPITVGGPSLVTAKSMTNHNDVDGDGNITVGDILTYSIVVTNNGTVTLNNVVVSDTMITPNSNTCPTVAPGNTCVLTGSYTVQQSDVDNGQIVNTGTGDSDETPPVDDEHIVDLPPSPALDTVKSLTGNADEDNSGTVTLGDTLTFTIEVTNTGNVTLTQVTVVDNMITPGSTVCPVLQVGEVCTLVGTYVVTQQDVNNGRIINVAEGDSTETGPDPDTDTETVIIAGPVPDATPVPVLNIFTMLLMVLSLGYMGRRKMH